MTDLLSRLPTVRGDYNSSAALAQHTWFGVGGPADILFCPCDTDDLAAFLAACPADIAVTVIGAGSNLLVRDGGVAGVVIKMNAYLTNIRRDGNQIIAQTGANDSDVARYAQKAGIGGLEFLIGIPGTIGGGLRMNAGAYGSEFKDITLTASGFDRQGRAVTATPTQMGMGYRESDAPADWIFTTAVLTGHTDDPTAIKSRMKAIVTNRGDAQPRGVRTGGSTFANPDGGKAWQEIDKAGCRGLQIGAARVSDKHCNFLINTGGATALDIETLGETVRRRVQENGGPELRWEIRRIGRDLTAPKNQEGAE
jgi:UDP-N-acetylmuramate dehydrogenase